MFKIIASSTFQVRRIGLVFKCLDQPFYFYWSWIWHRSKSVYLVFVVFSCSCGWGLSGCIQMQLSVLKHPYISANRVGIPVQPVWKHNLVNGFNKHQINGGSPAISQTELSLPGTTQWTTVWYIHLYSYIYISLTFSEWVYEHNVGALSKAGERRKKAGLVFSRCFLAQLEA